MHVLCRIRRGFVHLFYPQGFARTHFTKISLQYPRFFVNWKIFFGVLGSDRIQVMENKEKYGYVYVLTNPIMSGYVKIGKSRDLYRRMQILNTSVYEPFYIECLFQTEKYSELENVLHDFFRDYRTNPKREFFKVDVEWVKKNFEKFVKLIPGENVIETIGKEMNKRFFREEEIAQEELAKEKRTRRKKLDFAQMNIELGATLSFVKDSAIQVVVVANNRVLYQNESYSLTEVTRKLLQKEQNVQPTPYWTFNGKNLKEIYEETYPMGIEED